LTLVPREGKRLKLSVLLDHRGRKRSAVATFYHDGGGVADDLGGKKGRDRPEGRRKCSLTDRVGKGPELRRILPGKR